jgi:hypothetical protein
MHFEKILIIGDGPSALSFAEHLIINKVRPTLISAGELSDDYLSGKLNLKNADLPWKFSTPDGSDSKLEVENNFSFYNFKGPGGFTNSWGAGCSKLFMEDIGVTDNFYKKLKPFYTICENRIGITSRGKDHLDSYLGSFLDTSRNVKLNPRFNFNTLKNENITIGFTRQAITTTDKSEFRKVCLNCNATFIHCEKGSVYNAANVLKEIRNQLKLILNSRAIKITKFDKGYCVEYIEKGIVKKINAEKVVLAAGTIETAKLMYSLLYSEKKVDQTLRVKLNHNPMTRLFFFSFRKNKDNDFNSGQVVGKIKHKKGDNFYLSLVDGVSVPTSEIISNFPFKWKMIYSVLDYLKKYLVFGFIFFPSKYSNVFLEISNGKYIFKENETENIKSIINWSRKKLRKFFHKNYLFLMPKILSYMTPGSDLHFGSTFPLGDKKYFNVNEQCEINGMPNLFIIDASWMPIIPEKPHTFTIMSNAIRVADQLIKK